MLNYNTTELLTQLSGSEVFTILGFIMIALGVSVTKLFTTKDKYIIISLAGLTTFLTIINAPIISMVILSFNVIFIAHRFISNHRKKLVTK